MINPSEPLINQAQSSSVPVRPAPGSSWRPVLLLLLACFALWSWTGGLWDLWGPDESRYVQVGKELLGRANWFMLTVLGQPYDQKPPLPFWIFAGLLRLSGGEVSTWALRLPGIFAGTLSVILTFLIGRRRLGERAGLLAAFVLLTCVQMIEDAPKAELNMMFSAGITLALYAWLNRPAGVPIGWGRLALLWGALAWAFFYKGPLCLVFFAAAVATEAVWSRSWLRRDTWRMALGLAAWLGLIGLWFWAQQRAAGSAFVSEQMREQTVERFLNGDHPEAVWYYLPRLPLCIFAPWGLLLFPAGVRLWRERRAIAPALRPVLGWVLIPLLMLSLASGKRQTYPIPLLPGLALIVGWYLDRLMAEGVTVARLGRVLAGIILLVGTALGAAAAAFYGRPDWAWNHGFFLTSPGLALLGLVAGAGVILGVWLWRQVRRVPQRSLAAVVAGVTGVGMLAALILYGVVNPGLNPNKTERLMAETVDRLVRERGLAQVGAIGRGGRPDFFVYGHYPVRRFETEAAFKAPAALPAVLVGRHDDWEDIAGVPERAGYRPVYHEAQEENEKKRLVVYARVAAPEEATVPDAEQHVALVGDSSGPPAPDAGVVAQIARAHDLAPLSGLFLLNDDLAAAGVSRQDGEPLGAAFAPVHERGIPIYAVLGNHDGGANGIGHRAYPAFARPERSCYTETIGAATFFVIDSTAVFRQPEQLLWLRERLANCASAWKILLVHQPLLNGPVARGGQTRLYRVLLPLLTGRNDVDVVVAAHQHYYERRAIEDGLLHLTIGTDEATPGQTLPPDPGRVAGISGRPGFVRLGFTRARLEVEAIDAQGRVFDQAAYADRELPAGLVPLPVERKTASR